MAVKIKFAPKRRGKGQHKGQGKGQGKPVSWRMPLLIAGSVVVACFIAFACVFGFYYAKYGHIVDERLEKPLFENTAKIYAAPQELRPGQKFEPEFIAQELRSAGYSVEGKGNSPMGAYSEGPKSITPLGMV